MPDVSLVNRTDGSLGTVPSDTIRCLQATGPVDTGHVDTGHGDTGDCTGDG